MTRTERVNTFLGKHLWLQFVLSVLCASALVLLLFPGPSVLSVVIRTSVMSVGGIAVVLATRRKEKRAAGSTDGLVALDRRLRRGDVPTDPAEREAMRALVGRRLHRTRHRVPALIFLGVLFCSVTVLTALSGGLRQTVGMALLTVLFLGWTATAGATHDRRLRTMDRALESNSRVPQPQRQ
ncbi:hypothetical protein QFZ75_000581 [Streptomyces sp. V3I8]|uniref:hypothetical protein n=1 Tax=Streptomyces sp. V3I8 TaxID=3042279 RepID=UPI0027895CCA|nr:hypothetical protein [Streptomyces sp. V3I8]MDQ1034165.1 hypothetical protein [Streptomyces sp. V3I8]